jgi:hypothetical protein
VILVQLNFKFLFGPPFQFSYVFNWNRHIITGSTGDPGKVSDVAFINFSASHILILINVLKYAF